MTSSASVARSQDQPPRPWNAVDSSLVGAALLALAACCVLTSAKKFFWYDEAVSWTLVTDPSLLHTIRAVSDGADGAPPLYHILAWGWVHILGRSELALRSFSCLGFLAALTLLWITLRRRYSTRAAAVGALVAFPMSRLVTYQLAEARFYGLLTALVALAVYLHARVCTTPDDRDAPSSPSVRLLVAMALTHTALVYTHVYGLIYSGTLLTALVATDRLAHRWRPRLYASIVVAWIALLPWVPSIRRAAAIARPRGWIPTPTPHSLITVLGLSITWPLVIVVAVTVVAWLGALASAPATNEQPAPAAARRHAVAIAAVAVAGAAIIWWLGAHAATHGESLRMALAHPSSALMLTTLIYVLVCKTWRYRSLSALATKEPLLIVAAAFVLVPVVGYVVSRTVMSIFVDRYFLPSTIAIGIVAASATESLVLALGDPDPEPGPGWAPHAARLAWGCLLAALALRPIWAAYEAPRGQRPGARLELALPNRAVVIVQDPLDLVPMLHYQQRPDIEYVYPMDREVAADPRAPSSALFNYNYFTVLEQHGYLRAASADSSSPLCTYSGLVVETSADTLWFAKRIEPDHTLITTPIMVSGPRGDSAIATIVRDRFGGRTGSCIPGVTRP